MAISNFDMWASEPTSTSRSGQHVAVILGLAVVCATVLLYIIVSSLSRPMPANSMPRPRRTSSNLVEDPRGDTGVPSMASVLAEKPRKDLNVPSASEKQLKPHSKRRKARSLLRRTKQICFRYTWLPPLTVTLVVLATYFVRPGPNNPLHHAIYLSYPLGSDYAGGPNMYGKGKLDIAFVAFYTVVLSFTREFLMQQILRPMALRAGLRGRGKQSRFMEQVYTAMYFAVFGPFGLYVMSRTPLWYFNTTAMFEGFPHRTHEAVFKAYYLLQASYWNQQAMVLMLQLEKPRKDFKELVLHHIVTLALIGLSYRFHFTYMGIGVYITHDISDFFLATSKTLNYLDSSVTGPYFVLFAGVWTYLRHFLNLRIIWATLTEFSEVGPFELNWETQQYKCWISQYITFALLASLQAVNLFWFFLILRIAKRYVFDTMLADERSDDETEDETIRPSEAKKALEDNTGMETDKPVVLINGKAVDMNGKTVEPEAMPEGIRTRSGRKG